MQLHTICCQYDRRSYRGSIERLAGWLATVEGCESNLIVVDNAKPGDWSRQVTDLTHQIGGDNSAREFSAFERGITFGERELGKPDAVLLATDALFVNGGGFLDYYDSFALRSALGAGAVTGWVDSFGVDLEVLGYRYDCWFRTHLLFVPAQVLREVGSPLSDVAREQIFSGDPASPFLADAPLCDNFRRQVTGWLTKLPEGGHAADGWHSAFALGPETLERFEEKVLCILREQALSARIRSASVPSLDVRALRRLREEGMPQSALHRSSWWWLGWKHDETPLAESEIQVDRVDLPARLRQGEAAVIEAYGWIAGPGDEIELRVGSDLLVRTSCDVPRPDVLAAQPQRRSAACGFEVSSRLEWLPAGLHEVVLGGPGLEEKRIGSIDVRPRFELEPGRWSVPDSARLDAPMPVAVEGVLHLSQPLAELHLSWNDVVLDAQVLANPLPPVHGLYRYEVAVHGEALHLSRPLHRLALEAVVETRGRLEKVEVWHQHAVVQPSEGLPHALRTIEIGPFDHTTNRTWLRLEGWVDSALGGEIELLDGLRRIAVAPVRRPTDGSNLAGFRLVHWVGELPPGEYELRLVFRRGDERFVLGVLRPQVAGKLPTVEVTATRLDRAEIGVLEMELAGRVVHHRPSGELFLRLGESSTPVFWGEPALAQPEDGEARRWTQPFQVLARCGLHDGLREAQLVDGVGQVIWRTLLGNALQTDPPEVRCEAIRAWSSESVELPTVYLHGRVERAPVGAVAELEVDGLRVARTAVEGGTFVLHAEPAVGERVVRLGLYGAERERLYDSGPIEVRCTREAVDPRLRGAVERTLQALDVAETWRASDEFVQSLLTANHASLPDFYRLVQDLGSGRPVSRPLGRPTPTHDEATPRRVLIVTWETPSAGHGGGLFLLQLMRELSRWHELTLMVCYGGYEEEWLEEARPFVRRLIPIERTVLENRGDQLLPGAGRQHVVELQRLLRREIRTGRYDLVELHSLPLLEHVVPAAIPQLLTLPEDPVGAVRRDLIGGGLTVAGVQDLLRSAHWLRRLGRSPIDRVLTVTDEDAESVAAVVGDGVPVQANPIGLDLSATSPAPTHDGPSPRLIFLGNYRHPPNVAAVDLVMERILPRIWQQIGGTEFEVVGGFTPAHFERYAVDPRVQVTGWVDDLSAHLKPGGIFLAPIFRGTGMRLKMLEAMGFGMAVISTPLASRGLEGEHGRHLLLAESVDDFVEQALDLLRHPERALELGRNARRLIEEQHSLQRRVAERQAIWDSCLGKDMEGRDR